MKIISCLRGEVFDVAVDLRRNSSTFLQWHAELLSETNHRTIVIPEGFAHGFQTLTKECELIYLHTATYKPEVQAGLNALDPLLAIDWPLSITVRSLPDEGHEIFVSKIHRTVIMNCRHCETPLKHSFVDLGFAPPSNKYLGKHDLNKPETHFPLRVKVCDECWLVQTEDYATPKEFFNAEYAYFSSISESWLTHAKNYSKKMTEQLNLTDQSLVVEVASNDGYLLKNFLDTGIPCLGIEPTSSTATVARKLGIPVLQEFFNLTLAKSLAAKGNKADLIVANNVYAHVQDINDFTKGLKELLKPRGTITLEFPHLLKLINLKQFDTIYHEHYSYLSLILVIRIFEAAGLRIWHVEELPTHGR